jgi:phospholipid transport system substrate-binding protein
MKIHRLAFLLLVVFSATQTVMAAPYPPAQQAPWQAPATARVDSNNPGTIIRAGVTKLTNFIKSGRAQNREQALAFMATEIEPYFDFGYMTRWAAGPAWRNMSPQQRAGMEQQLKESFMDTLAQKLVTYTDQPIRYFTPRGQGSNDVRVSAWIMQPNGIPTRLEFRFYRHRDGWKIFDVKAEGNSAVVYYRKQFQHLLQPEQRSRYYY